MSLVDIIQIIIGIMTLVATIAVSFTIYWLQLRHEKEMQKIAKLQEHKELEEILKWLSLQIGSKTCRVLFHFKSRCRS